MATPKYLQVYRDLRDKIVRGSFAPRDSLAGETRLCAQYGVSRATLRKAVELLKRDGLVHSRQGSGVYVNPPELFGAQARTAAKGVTFRDDSTAGCRSRLLEMTVVPAGRLSGEFKVNEMMPLVRYQLLMHREGAPHAIIVAHLPQMLIKDLARDDPPGLSIVRLEATCKKTITHVNHRARACAATRSQARLLEIGEGAPVLRITHRAFLPHGVLVQHANEYTVRGELNVTIAR